MIQLSIANDPVIYLNQFSSRFQMIQQSLNQFSNLLTDSVVYLKWFSSLFYMINNLVIFSKRLSNLFQLIQ